MTADWDHLRPRDRLQRRLADAVAALPLGVVGVIDETSCVKKGEKTPGVRRQDLGCVGKIDNGIVTVHVGVTTGRFQALLDAELYLPQSWAADRERCREAGIPDDVRYRAKCGSARPFHRPSAPPPEKLPCAPLLTPSLWGLLVRNRRTGVFA